MQRAEEQTPCGSFLPTAYCLLPTPSIHPQELYEILQHAIAQAGVARVVLRRLLADARLGVTAEHRPGLLTVGGCHRLDVGLGKLEMILESEQSVLEPKRLVPAQL